MENKKEKKQDKKEKDDFFNEGDQEKLKEKLKSLGYLD
jgi:hypothetical protein